MDQKSSPTVFIDGAAVRRIREQKKLTQLYVAKVAGVTTDTISRWENNRYPSIKRENALRLAEALEVPLEALLQRESGEYGDGKRRKGIDRRLYAAAAIFFAFAVVYGIFILANRQEVTQPDIRATRVLPNYAAPGSVIPVQIQFEGEAEVKGFILREQFPRGWKLIEANPPASSLDNEEGMARWIVRSGKAPQRIVYLVKVGEDAETEKEALFNGELVSNVDKPASPLLVSGTGHIMVAPFQWADLNGDNIVDDGEMLKASDTVDAMEGVHVDWEHLEEIWGAGSYRWDAETKRFAPFKLPRLENTAQ